MSFHNMIFLVHARKQMHDQKHIYFNCRFLSIIFNLKMLQEFARMLPVGVKWWRGLQIDSEARISCQK